MATTARPHGSLPLRRAAAEMTPGVIVLARYGMRSCDGSGRPIESGEDLIVTRAPSPDDPTVGVADFTGDEFTLWPSQLRVDHEAA